MRALLLGADDARLPRAVRPWTLARVDARILRRTISGRALEQRLLRAGELAAVRGGGWGSVNTKSRCPLPSKSVLDRYNVTSERDLADALEHVTRYNAERSAETPKVEPLRAEPAQSGRQRGDSGAASGYKSAES